MTYEPQVYENLVQMMQAHVAMKRKRNRERCASILRVNPIGNGLFYISDGLCNIAAPFGSLGFYDRKTAENLCDDLNEFLGFKL